MTRTLARALASALVLAACDDPAPRAERPAPTAAVLAKPAVVRGPTGGAEIAPFVRAQIASHPRGHVLVYVGATWCEPCQHWKAALASGELDDDFPELVLVEQDLDADGAALEAAGYASKMIPLFAVPGKDGRGTDRKISGSIKGPEAVAEITLRLNKLVAGEPVE